MSKVINESPSTDGNIPASAPEFRPNSSASSQTNDVPEKVILFEEIISRFWLNYFNFSGRATRSEYWWSMLFVMFVNLNPLMIFATFIPTLAINCRRYNDAKAKISFGSVLALSIIIPIIAGLILFNPCVDGSGHYSHVYYSNFHIIGLIVCAVLEFEVLPIYHLVICCSASKK